MDNHEQFYSRQIGTYGEKFMTRIRKLKVYVKNINAVGCEVVKNLVLSGVCTVYIDDPSIARPRDRGRNFALTADSVGRRRVDEAVVGYFQKLNPSVEVRRAAVTPQDYDVLVACTPLSEWEELERQHTNKWFIGVDINGTAAVIWCRPADNHVVEDADGEAIERHLCEATDRDSGIIVIDSDEHQLRSGDFLAPLAPLAPSAPSASASAHGDTIRVVEVRGKTLHVESCSNNFPQPGIYIERLPRRAGTVSLPYASFSAHPQQTFDTVIGSAAFPDVSAFTSRRYDTEWHPLAAFVGGVVAQEALKHVGKYMPMTGLTLVHFGQPNADAPLEEEEEEDRYYDARRILGPEVFRAMSEKQVFVVGCGAIGCEALKNLAMVGIGSGATGRVHVTDMDRIELSNLNRQFLFHREDIHEWKSETARRKILGLNADVKMTSYTLPVGKESAQTVFGDDFWKSLDLVVNALDNIEARRFVDGQCRWYRKPLYESGTMGTKGNFQMICPDRTETYMDSQDPPEKEIPVCTIKSFPYHIEHCVQWAREMLEYLLRELPEKVLGGEQADLDAAPGDGALVAWSGRLLERVFVEDIQALLRKHPATAMDETTGVPFWSGKKRVPRLVDARNELFVRAHIEVLSQLRVVFSAEDGKTVRPVEFDKDDDSNGQIDCIHALTNLRAFVYDIPSTDRATCHHVAGKIIPAISCTTSAVTGRAVSEIFHLRCTNMFMNLGLNLYLESEAGPPLKIQTGFNTLLQAEVLALPGPHTCWDRHVLDSLSHDGATLGDLKTRMETEFPSIRVTSISAANEMLLYSEFMDVSQTDAVLASELKGDQFQIDGETDEGDIVIFPIVVVAPKFQGVSPNGR